MSDFSNTLNELFELHRITRERIEGEDAVTPGNLSDFDNAFLAFIVISTASHIEEENKAIQKKMRDEGWDEEKVPALMKFLWNFTEDKEQGEGDSEFTKAVDAYVKLRRARNHLAHKNVRRSVFPYEWGKTEVQTCCECALEFPGQFRKYAAGFVGRERAVREDPLAAR